MSESGRLLNAAWKMGQSQSIEDEDMARTNSDTDTIDTDTTVEDHFRLLDLPSELIDHILSYLPPVALARICQTCMSLNLQASTDRLWKVFLEDCIQKQSHRPFLSWKEMYATHYPYWFLAKRKIWFSDKTTLSNPLVGQLMLARYDHRIGSIEGYRLVAEHPEIDTFFRWSHDPNVLVHNFDPRVSLFLDDPVIKLDQGAFESGKSRLQQEVWLGRGENRTLDAIKARLFPTVAIPRHRQVASMSLWPPPTIPSPDRVRNESPTLFEDPSHKPKTYEQMSTIAFRLRKWLMFIRPSDRLGINTAQDVITYGTILPEYYMPTIEKPYQGLWVGDYAGHGCEFLVIIQSTPEEAQRLPPVHESPTRDALEEFVPSIVANLPPSSTPDPVGCSGRLDAIKLTGDPNVPRGQPTWIAEDISRNGLVRIAQENEFINARVVKSSGHIAGGGFRMDRYTPSQLIMISEDRLAQYWIEMGHISFFNRINIDDYIKIP